MELTDSHLATLFVLGHALQELEANQTMDFARVCRWRYLTFGSYITLRIIPLHVPVLILGLVTVLKYN